MKLKPRVRMIDGQTYITQRQAAQRLGVCQATMKKLVASGDVSIAKIRNVRSVWVCESDVEKILKGE